MYADGNFWTRLEEAKVLTENARLSYRSRDNASRLDKVHVIKSDNYLSPGLHPRFNLAQTVLGQTFVRRSDTQIVFYIILCGV